ncbi:interferon-induced very large GTPase 1-like [Astyanax mexicanus]|uniref:interferon-induced very large GTPase 1-like n=1 Tax=Astyanax mexicanus TaxID=7994 RepID=UPI0020CB5D24|nr:interferon-induced very large GTPase 1-like [Astyanax mexicanus]
MPEDQTAQNLKSLPLSFLKKIMLANTTARSTERKTTPEHTINFRDKDLEELNPLDLITAVFLCSDPFLQQELSLKMSLCQFAIPFLLPNSDTQQCTLMMWAMRDIVKKCRPHCSRDRFEENSIVLANMPMVSFARLGKCSLSKSGFLNKLLSKTQQHHDTFVYKEMVSGNIQRKISNGLVEISWYLPSGKKNDIFKEPLAVTNLRGDIFSFETQFSFLCETSTAVFLFCDDLDAHQEFLSSLQFKARLVLVCPSSTKDLQSALVLKPNTLLLVKCKNENDAVFVIKLHETVAKVVKDSQKLCIEKMSAIATDLGIEVDENNATCQNAKKKADSITEGITDISKYKNLELPLQGELWKELSNLEKEECRLKHAGEKNIEHYKTKVQEKIQELRKQQSMNGITRSILLFNSSLNGSQEERSYFLKWMKINLDNLTRKNLTQIEEIYKAECQNSAKDEQRITELENQIANSGLGIEHYFREIGQLYESSPYQNHLKNLPKICAELMLNGFPLELVDGDASNIPMNWVGDVIKELNQLTKPNNTIRVVTVLGVQSTGKSTLLNTMFGVQFAVSSGRCTRGAFMLLIKVAEEYRKELKCDFIMIIDTEGLKAPALAKLPNSYEHDNELATLVVGLSDFTVVNIAMENAADMKDTLQIVVHAFLRMKEVGKKPCCHFVHQNVGDVDAHDKTLRDRKIFLEQLNEATQHAAKMENKGNNKRFSDILDYQPEKNNWYIPSLWLGTPPMAAVNTGYSDEVYDLKQSILKHFKSVKGQAHDFVEFEKWAESLWKAVKYENFIFSFRNSLVAEAYSKLCTEFHTWEWAFKKEVNAWFISSETKISNMSNGTTLLESAESVNIDDLLMSLKYEAAEKVTTEGETLEEKIKQYFEREDNHVHLVEKYKEDFLVSALSLKRETEMQMKRKLESAVEIQKSKAKLEDVRQKQRNIMKQRVLDLINVCKKKTHKLSERELEEDFQEVWDKAVQECSFNSMPKQDVASEILSLLRSNLQRKGGAVREMLSSITCLEEYGTGPFVTKRGKDNLLFRLLENHHRYETTMRIQDMSKMIINSSKQFIELKTSVQSDYNTFDVQDLLCHIDERLKQESQLDISPEHEASLKIYICAHAAREFQRMHDAFIEKNDPRKTLEKFKSQWLADFKDFYYQRDQCNTKADVFAEKCLLPAVTEYIQKSLGPDIVDEMLTSRTGIDFSTRSFFQFSFLKELLLGQDFSKMFQYIESYEESVTLWILEQIIKHFSREDRLVKLETQHLKSVIAKIKKALVNAQTKLENACGSSQENLRKFVTHFCTDLRKELVLSADSLDSALFLNYSSPNEFAECLKSSVEKMQANLTMQLHRDNNVRVKLGRMPMMMPQKELFSRVFGCGKRCPFCRAPCEAGGKKHTEHFASVHRPQGLGNFTWVSTKKLIPDICSSLVASEKSFRCKDTGNKWHPYSDYRRFYPEWRIQPDTSIEASDFWKYIFTKYNKKFADEYKAFPADIPDNWHGITLQQAQSSLEDAFMMRF